MDVAKEHTLDYLRTRKQFGVPIGTFQALQRRMADVLLDIEQARSAAINAAAAVATAGVERELTFGADGNHRLGKRARRLEVPNSSKGK